MGTRSGGRWRRRGAPLVALGAFVACFAGASAAADATAPRIVGGNETTTEEWPWQVALTNRGVFTCGGSLIAPDIVLTAAHCAQDREGAPVPSEELGAVFDLSDLSDEQDPDAFAMGIRETFVSPRFDLDSLAAGFDFALMLLSAPLEHDTIELATGAEERRFDEHTRVWATGWGLVDGNPAIGTSVLHEVDLKLVDCSSELQFSDTLFFCVAGSDGACRGDSGGPLMIRRRAGEFLQIGVSTFSDLQCENFSAWTNVANGPVRAAVDRVINVLQGIEPPPEGPANGAVDTTRPQTTITKGPKGKIRTRRKRVRVRIRFTASEASTFTCSLDHRRPRACASPIEFRVRKGPHRFQVFATDAAGNADPIPDTVSWRVQRLR